MRKNVLLLMLVCVGASAVSACIGYERRSSTSPTAIGTASLVGSWSSSATALPSPTTCTNFRWNVTEQSGNTASGTFSATCAGNLQVAGTANGILSASGVTWNATASASVPNLPSCPITLTGTAEIGVDSIRVPYSGDTCLGKVNGVEVLRKN